MFQTVNKKLERELNALFFKDEYLKENKRIEIVGIDKKTNRISEAIDKLRSSGTYTGNQIRVMLGDDQEMMNT